MNSAIWEKLSLLCPKPDFAPKISIKGMLNLSFFFFFKSEGIIVSAAVLFGLKGKPRGEDQPQILRSSVCALLILKTGKI